MIIFNVETHGPEENRRERDDESEHTSSRNDHEKSPRGDLEGSFL
jgi:hypothetical protein